MGTTGELWFCFGSKQDAPLIKRRSYAFRSVELVWQIQLALGSGYAAYLLCYAGIRAGHTTVDTTFQTLIFGLIATGVLTLGMPYVHPVAAGAAAFVVACLSGVLWRLWGRNWIRAGLRKFDVSWSDDTPSALATLLENTKHRVAQISVQLEDGTWLRCDDVSRFANAPFGPCRIGPNGDVALYLTHEQPKEGDARELKTVQDPIYGDRITYIPASKIRTINFRHQLRR